MHWSVVFRNEKQELVVTCVFPFVDAMMPNFQFRRAFDEIEVRDLGCCCRIERDPFSAAKEAVSAAANKRSAFVSDEHGRIFVDSAAKRSPFKCILVEDLSCSQIGNRQQSAIMPREKF